MWDALREYFSRYPSQAKIVRLMLKYGLRVHCNRIYCGTVQVADTAIARAADVDRRVVSSTISTIMSDDRLRRVFSSLSPTPHLKDAAHVMGWNAIEIIATDPCEPAILSRVSGVISDAGISIRQAIVDDPYLTAEPKLFIVTETQVPPHLIPSIKSLPGVKSVTII